MDLDHNPPTDVGDTRRPEDVLWERLAAIEHDGLCGVSGCPRSVWAKGYCDPHYKRLRRYGSPTADPRRLPNNYVKDGIGYLDLGNGVFARVDSADFARVADACWHLNSNGYARSSQGYLHRFLMPGVAMVDHINHDRLDCRRSNLRPSSPSQNGLNRDPATAGPSGFVGVSWLAGRRKPWRAYVTVAGRQKTIGYFRTPEDAAEMRAAWLSENV